MNPVAQLLTTLSASNIRLQVTEKGELAVRGDKQKLTSELVQQIKALKPEIIAWLSADAPTQNTIATVPRTAADYPLSYAQQRLWFIQSMTGPSAQYNMFSAFELQGRVDLTVLEAALQQVVERHEVLRSTYVNDEGEGRQQIIATCDLPPLLSVIEPSANQQIEPWLAAQVQQCSQQGFDLAVDIPIRCYAFRCDPTRIVVLFVMHHIASDEWSLSVAAQELMQSYQQALLGQSTALAALPVQYVDYATWQQNYLATEAGEKAAAYFTEQLSDAPEVHNLPTDYPRLAQQDFSGTVQSFALSNALSQQLRAFAHEQQVTLFVLLEAAFSVLIARASAEQNVVIGTPVAGRSQPELQGMIGFFVNTLPLHHRVDLAQPFTHYLHDVKQQINTALSHQDYPFDLLVEQLRPERSLSYSPVVQLVFTVADNQAQRLQLPDLHVEDYPVTLESAKFDLSVSCFDGEQNIDVHWNYATRLFTAERIHALQQQFSALLTSVCAMGKANKSLAIGDLALMSIEQAEQQWSRPSNHVTPATLAQDSVVAQFDAIAIVSSDNIAVRDSERNQHLTFAQLHQRSVELAKNLLHHGVKSGDRVALYIDRSLDMVVAMLAILRADAAYVPLDIHNPVSRSQYIVDDSQPSVLLTRQNLSDELSALSLSCNIVHLDKLAEGELPALQATPSAQSLAYIIYTSGSTGKPKGVMVQQRNILTLVAATNFYPPAPGDIIAQCANHAFDAATFEIWSALLHGNSTCIISRDQLLDLDTFNHVLQQENINVMFLSSGIFNQMVQRHPDAFARLKLLAFGGDAAEVSNVNQVIKHGKPTHFYNIYGPTETTTFSCFYPITAEIQEAPIGVALAGHQHIVVDSRQQPVPDGVVGELYIAGGGVSQGYWQREQLTEAAFVWLNDAKGCQQRFYRTGDLVKYRADGQLCFVGRVDKQIKLRGFRVELGEIVHRLQEQSAVDEALVSVAGEGERKYLVAYLVPAESDNIADDALIQQSRDLLAMDLPDYMQPSGYLCVEKLPLNANGKVDMHALPAVPLVSNQIIKASTQTEEVLQTAWANLLQMPSAEFGVTQNFFALGGHSLLATKLQSHIADTLNVRLPIRAFFEYPTIEQLAACIDNPHSSAPLNSLVIPQRTETGPCALSFSQQRVWFIDAMQGSSVEYHMPVAMRLTGNLQREALQQALDALVARHAMLRTVYQQTNNIAQQITQDPRPVAIHYCDWRHQPSAGPAPSASDEALNSALAQQIQQPFDLTCDLMLRVALWQLADEEYVLLFNQHHIASDGWSFDILTRDFSVLYQQALSSSAINPIAMNSIAKNSISTNSISTNGSTDPLPSLALQYTDYAQWQQNQLADFQSQPEHADDNGTLAQQLQYWQQQLNGLPQVHNLPLDHPRPALQSFAGNTQHFPLTPELSQQLKAFANQHDVSLFMLLQSAFAVFISRWSGEQDVAIGTPVAGREHSQLQDIVGFFVNNLVLRSDVQASQGFTEFLAQQKNTILNAFSHQDVPFDLLVEVLQPERSLSHSPLYQVVFAMQAPAQQTLTLPELSIEGMVLADNTSKFDLQLTVLDQRGEALLCGWQYATSLFSEHSIAHMANSFAQLLADIIQYPAHAIGDLRLVTAQQQHWLAQAHGPAFNPATTPLIHERFSAQASKTPSAIAAQFGADNITYQQLEQRSNQLAQALRKKGVGQSLAEAQPHAEQQEAINTEHLVGLFVHRSIDMLVGMLGILKAGGAYVPLDTNYPAARLHYMLNDVQAQVVVTQTALVAQLPAESVQHVMCLDDATYFTDDSIEPVAPVLPEDSNRLAYVIYTSGSTGNPKGVMVTHRNVVRLIENNNYVDFRADDVVAQASNHSFDAATFEIWGALTHGARLAYIDKDTFLDPLLLKQTLQDQRINIFFITTALVNQMAYVAADGFKGLRYLLFGGEAVDINAVAQLLEQGKPTHLLHVYGPTESTTFSTFYEITQQRSDTYPIGQSIAGTTQYVLDAQQQLVPPGVVGELYLGGDGVARGYLHREEQTQQVFIPNTFKSEQDSSARLYKTGDLVRCDSHGDLIYVARVDHQVKLRGFRIELGEIENALRQVPIVEEALVAVIGEGVQRRLVAWFTNDATYTNGAESADNASAVEHAIASCRAALVGELPDYMQPTAYACLTEFPLTPNGKIDRKALPEPQVQVDNSEFIAAETPVEIAIVAVWQQLFEQEPISVVANFFNLGGHSILATRLVAELNQQLNVALTVRDIFEQQTVRSQAAKVEQLQQSGETAANNEISQRFTDNADVEEIEL